MPGQLVDNAHADYDPYATPNHAGSAEKARAEMKLSRYDTDKDGVCDASVCKGIINAIPDDPNAVTLSTSIAHDLAKIGITIEERVFADYFSHLTKPSSGVVMSSGAGLGPDFPDPFGYFSVFTGSSIASSGNFNYALIGLTPEIAKSIGIRGNIPSVPNIDDEIQNCKPMTGAERQQCWLKVDEDIMERVVPYAPFWARGVFHILSAAVTRFDVDPAFFGFPALDQAAVDASKQP
jgi:ABC-type transport system substrate-binding protein